MMAATEENKNDLGKNELNTDIDAKAYIKKAPFKIARPLSISMSLFGLLHFSRKERRWAPILQIYSTVVLLLMWAMLVRSLFLYRFETTVSIFLSKLAFDSWTFTSVVATSSMYLACRKQNKFDVFLTSWSKLLELNHERQAHKDFFISNHTRQAKLCYSCLVISWLSVFLDYGLLWHSNFRTNNLDFIIAPVDHNHPLALLLKCLWYVMNCYICAVDMFTLCLFCSLGFVIYEEFRTFRLDFEKALGPNGDVVDIGHYRRRHQDICQLVENADDILSAFSAACIASSVVCAMLILYSVIGNRQEHTDLSSLLCSLLWLLYSLGFLCLVAVGGGCLNHVAHAPLKTIHKVQLGTISTETSHQMTMFLSKLTAEPIGLTAMGMFVIAKPTILTIAGVFVTYYIVLVQLQTPSGQQEVLLNSTAV